MQMAMTNPIHRFKETVDLAQAATTAILTAAEQAIASHGAFKIVLAGGNTPTLVYQQLSQSQAQWDKWWIFWGDERCLAADDPERNSLMAIQAWLSKVTIPCSQIFPISAEHGAQQAARAYEQQIKRHLPFDLVLLGMGEDGHTASLFPCHPHNLDELVHAVYPAPKLPANRVSLSVKALSDSEDVSFLITGANKFKAFKLWQKGVNLPVAQIQARKNTVIYADYAALGQT
jgi:6-phosphogluconolactonase